MWQELLKLWEIQKLSPRRSHYKTNGERDSEMSTAAAAAAKSLQSCPTLCDPIDGSPPGSPVPGILQARTLEWVAISFSNAWKLKVKVKSLSRVWLFTTPLTAAYQIFQARVLEWVAIAFSLKWVQACPFWWFEKALNISIAGRTLIMICEINGKVKVIRPQKLDLVLTSS